MSDDGEPQARLNGASRLLLTGYGASLFGDGMFIVAIGFAVLALGGGPGALGLVLLSGLAMILILILPAGVFVDGRSRRRVVAAADVVRGCAQLASAAIVAWEGASWWYLLPCSVVFGIASALHQPAALALVADVVPAQQRDAVNGAVQALRGVGMVLGGALAGVIVARSGPVPVIVADACTFLLCAACVLAIREPARATADGVARAGDLREAIDLVRTQQWLRRGLLLVGGFVLVAYAPIQVAGPVYADSVAGGTGLAGPELWASMSAATAVGMIAGGVTAMVRPPSALLAVVRLLLVVGALGMLAIAAGVHPFVSLPGFAALGAAIGLFSAGWETVKQSRIKQGMLARVAALDGFVQLCCMVTGVAVAAVLAAAAGPEAVLVWIAVGCSALAMLAGVGGSLARVFRERRATAPAPER